MVWYQDDFGHLTDKVWSKEYEEDREKIDRKEFWEVYFTSMKQVSVTASTYFGACSHHDTVNEMKLQKYHTEQPLGYMSIGFECCMA